MSGYARHHGAESVDPALLIAKPFTHEELVARVESVLSDPAIRPQAP